MTAFSSKKLSANSRPVVQLREWLSTGKISGEEAPSTVQSMSPIFQGYKADNFRRAYNKLRKEVRSAARQAAGNDDVAIREPKRRCSDDGESSAKRLKQEVPTDWEDDGSELSFVFEDRVDVKSFKPFYLVSSWIERRTTTKRLSVAVCLPSGVGSDDYSIRVTNRGMTLEMRCMWPKEFCNVETLHRKWLNSSEERLEIYHLKLSGFDNFLKGLRKRNSDAVDQVSNIHLPFSVESHIHGLYNLACETPTHVLCT